MDGFFWRRSLWSSGSPGECPCCRPDHLPANRNFSPVEDFMGEVRSVLGVTPGAPGIFSFLWHCSSSLKSHGGVEKVQSLMLQSLRPFGRIVGDPHRDLCGHNNSSCRGYLQPCG